jgi:hypothetical protein
MKLMRGPPVESSADTELVSIVTSAAAPTFGVEPPMPPPACSVAVETPFCVTRMSCGRLPCAISIAMLSPMAPPTSCCRVLELFTEVTPGISRPRFW